MLLPGLLAGHSLSWVSAAQLGHLSHSRNNNKILNTTGKNYDKITREDYSMIIFIESSLVE